MLCNLVLIFHSAVFISHISISLFLLHRAPILCRKVVPVVRSIKVAMNACMCSLEKFSKKRDKNKTLLEEIDSFRPTFWLLLKHAIFNYKWLFLETFQSHWHSTLSSQFHQLWALPQRPFVAYIFPVFPLRNTVSRLPFASYHLLCNTCLNYGLPCGASSQYILRNPLLRELEGIFRNSKYSKDMHLLTYLATG